MFNTKASSRELRCTARAIAVEVAIILCMTIYQSSTFPEDRAVNITFWVMSGFCVVVVILLYYRAHCAQKREEAEETEKMWLYFTYESQIKHVETTVHTRQEAADLLAQIEVYHAKHSISEEDYTRVRKQLLDFLADEDSCEE